MTKKYSYNENSDKRIWIDLDNSPHVPFFAPITKFLQDKGYDVVISARNYSQTVLLADLYKLSCTPIGKHHGKNKIIKIIGLLYRSIQMVPFVIKSKPTVAISHGSRSQMIVAFLFRIPIAMFLDYEFIQTIPFVKPKIIFLPSIISQEKVKEFGNETFPYPGIKEDVYIPSFKPNENLLRNLKIDTSKIIVVVRPPAHEAHYHNPESEILFNEIISHLEKNDSVVTVILPRDKRQKQQIELVHKKYLDDKNLIIPTEVLDGLNLMWNSDLVISGGGTMNREAAALGLPVYSIFRGKIGDVDKYLAENKRLVLIESKDDISKIILKKRDKINKLSNVNSLSLQAITNKLEHFVNIAYKANNLINRKVKNAHEISANRKS
jgi:predicted glycosyltransferase